MPKYEFVRAAYFATVRISRAALRRACPAPRVIVSGVGMVGPPLPQFATVPGAPRFPCEAVKAPRQADFLRATSVHTLNIRVPCSAHFRRLNAVCRKNRRPRRGLNDKPALLRLLHDLFPAVVCGGSFRRRYKRWRFPVLRRRFDFRRVDRLVVNVSTLAKA